MSWGRMDDTFHDHPKVEELSLAAVGLWAKCWSVALRHERTAPVKGFVSEKKVREFAGTRAKALTLELTTPIPGKTAGMWEPVERGYIIHDFTDYLPKQRDPSEASASGRRGAAKRWGNHGKSDGSSHSSPDSSDDAQGQPTANGSKMADDGSRASRSASPSRPVPSPTTDRSDSGEDRNGTLPASDATEPTCSRHPNGDGGTACGGCRRVREHRQRADERALIQDRDRAERERTAAVLAEQNAAKLAAQKSSGRPDSTRRVARRRDAS